jgi:16S rRNA (cytidine1402-2'-O)-methyltransferase
MPGTLYLVATPIGNLDDITIRAVKTLETVDLILAEDTRVSKKLLSLLNIHTPMRSYHDYNKDKMIPVVIAELQQERSVALISDAGTPGIADPGFCLGRAAIEAGITVVPIPGPSALIAALIASGLPTDRFVFENFLPVKSGRRCRLLETFKAEKRTVIFYESPHRILKTLRDIDAVLGDVRVVIAREITKLHEEFLRGTARELLSHYENRTPRGEMVVLLNTVGRADGGESGETEPETGEVDREE